MRRREFITVGGIAALLWPVRVRAQEAGRTYRLGFLVATPRSAPYWLEVFDELRQAGFVEGQNLTVDFHQWGPHVDLIPQFGC
jgi:putative tryptophan/tyrosine transport system substrate-binding protein